MYIILHTYYIFTICILYTYDIISFRSASDWVAATLCNCLSLLFSLCVMRTHAYIYTNINGVTRCRPTLHIHIYRYMYTDMYIFMRLARHNA